MKRLITAILPATLPFIAASAIAAQTSVSIGIQIGPPPPRQVVYVAPKPPRPDYVWIDGYWYPVKNQYKWHDGYWTRPPYPGARWVEARYDGRMFFEGYWIGERGRREHDHKWDHDRERDHHGDNNDQGKGHRKGHGDRD